MATPVVVGSSHPYQDSTCSSEARVTDLLSLMSIPEKAGQLFHDMIASGINGTLAPENPVFGVEDTQILLKTKLISHFNLIGPINDPQEVAVWHNNMQQAAMETRLGIPVTLSTDPRHHFVDNVGTSFNAGSFSQWPETLGLAALRDPDLVERFADSARQEYLAVGLRVALHPQIDLATEPRWARINATFGEDADLSAKLGAAYIRGFQGAGENSKEGVSCMAKHFPGGGPQKDGEDPHFEYGREQVYPGDQFEYHLRPFKEILKSGVRQLMPYYGMPVGLQADVAGNGTKEEIEQVGFAFNKQMITSLLRQRLGFQGIICTDWGLLTDATILGQSMPARAWGCEHLEPIERAAKILNAGCDQFGGETCPELIIKAVENGLISEQRLDESVSKLLKEKFDLGLFDDKRFVDIQSANYKVGSDSSRKAGEDAQRKSYTLLKNKDDILPLRLDTGQKVYAEGFDKSLLVKSAPDIHIVDNPEDASIALVRIKTPYEPRSGGFEAFFHAGSLEFSAEEKQRQSKIYQACDTIVDIYLDRPAIIPDVADRAAALLCSYGSSADAFLDVVLGSAAPLGKLPFDLPRSTEAVSNSGEDVPFNTKDPLFKFGDGLSYSR